MERITKSQHRIIEQNLVLVGGANDIEHDVGFHLVQDNSVVVEDDIARLLGRLVNKALLESLLRLQVGIRVARYACAAYQTSSPLAMAHTLKHSGRIAAAQLNLHVRTGRSGVRRRKVFGKYPGAILSSKDEDCLDGEEGHSRRHFGGWLK